MRYTNDDYKNELFYQMPQALFEGVYKEKLGNDAKVLYSLLKNRHNLSVKKKWLDKNGCIYMFFTREEMIKEVGVSAPTLRKAIEQLKDCGLFEEVKQGFNKPNIIYLHKTALSSDAISVDIEIENTVNENEVSVGSEKYLHSKVKNDFTTEEKNLTPNKNDIKNNNLSYNNHIQSYQELECSVKEQIGYDILIDMPIINSKEVDEIMQTMMDVLTSTSKTLRVNREDKPIEIIRSVYRKLNQYHIVYALNSIRHKSKNIGTYRSYVYTVLYNAYQTYELNANIKSREMEEYQIEIS